MSYALLVLRVSYCGRHIYKASFTSRYNLIERCSKIFAFQNVSELKSLSEAKETATKRQAKTRCTSSTDEDGFVKPTAPPSRKRRLSSVRACTTAYAYCFIFLHFTPSSSSSKRERKITMHLRVAKVQTTVLLWYTFIIYLEERGVEQVPTVTKTEGYVNAHLSLKVATLKLTIQFEYTADFDFYVNIIIITYALCFSLHLML